LFGWIANYLYGNVGRAEMSLCFEMIAEIKRPQPVIPQKGSSVEFYLSLPMRA